MFYKLSMIPFLLSIVYLVYELFNIDIQDGMNLFLLSV